MNPTLGVGLALLCVLEGRGHLKSVAEGSTDLFRKLSWLASQMNAEDGLGSSFTNVSGMKS